MPKTISFSTLDNVTPPTNASSSSSKYQQFSSKKWYAVAVGRIPGVYSTWSECQDQIKSFPKATYKSFTNYDDAVKFATPQTKEKVNFDYRIFTDGSCTTGSSAKGGYGFIVTYKNQLLDGYHGPLTSEKHTNNIAELTAIKRSLVWLTYNNCQSVEIVSDSLYSINSIVHYNGNVKANKELIEEIVTLFQQVTKNTQIVFTHINSHQVSSEKDDIYYNNFVDRLADSGKDLIQETRIDLKN